MALTDHAAVVRHVSKRHVIIKPAKGYRVTTFKLTDGNVEAIVSDGSETIRLLVAGPGPTQTMDIGTDQDTGVVDIFYTETPTT